MLLCISKKMFVNVTDIESLTHEYCQCRIDLAGLLTYSCSATFPMFISGIRLAEPAMSSQLRDSSGFSPDSLFTFVHDGTKAPNPVAKVRINFKLATPDVFLLMSLYPLSSLSRFSVLCPFYVRSSSEQEVFGYGEGCRYHGSKKGGE